MCSVADLSHQKEIIFLNQRKSGAVLAESGALSSLSFVSPMILLIWMRTEIWKKGNCDLIWLLAQLSMQQQQGRPALHQQGCGKGCCVHASSHLDLCYLRWLPLKKKPELFSFSCSLWCSGLSDPSVLMIPFAKLPGNACFVLLSSLAFCCFAEQNQIGEVWPAEFVRADTGKKAGLWNCPLVAGIQDHSSLIERQT